MPPRPRFDRRAPVRELPNINDRISYPQLRVVDSDGSQGDQQDILDVAKDRELDLVLVSEGRSTGLQDHGLRQVQV